MVREGVFHTCYYSPCDYSEIAACMERNVKHSAEHSHLSNAPQKIICPFKNINHDSILHSFHICNFPLQFCFQSLAVPVCKASLMPGMDGMAQGGWRGACTQERSPGAIQWAAVLCTVQQLSWRTVQLPALLSETPGFHLPDWYVEQQGVSSGFPRLQVVLQSAECFHMTCGAELCDSQYR